VQANSREGSSSSTEAESLASGAVMPQRLRHARCLSFMPGRVIGSITRAIWQRQPDVQHAEPSSNSRMVGTSARINAAE
jgi:hypothetical protein